MGISKAQARPPVQLGIDVLEANHFSPIVSSSDAKSNKNKKIGLLTNQTGLDSRGRRTIDILAHAPGLTLVAIFSPEHGLSGSFETTNIADSRDPETGVPIYSVYGSTNAARRPSPSIISQLDAIVIDLQDVGARFYTYQTTLGYFLEAADKKEVYVLDRPNPITGSMVQGPVSDPGRESFVNYAPTPIRAGLTIGELALFINTERLIHAKLQVIEMKGWKRTDWFDQTGLQWINPSPNLRNLTEATLYPGVALIEQTNVSVGRGTATPFELIGAPWINPRKTAKYLNKRKIAGVKFASGEFTPKAGPYAGEPCQAIIIQLTDRNSLDSPELGIELASALYKLYPKQFQIDKMMALLNNQSTLDAIKKGTDPRSIAASWRDSLAKFSELRQQYLLYK
ncbi:MAG TPA: DUF1343 domain-containing protein [Terriglobales bacterium]